MLGTRNLALTDLSLTLSLAGWDGSDDLLRHDGDAESETGTDSRETETNQRDARPVRDSIWLLSKEFFNNN